jgi:hypothetical protein
MREIAGWVETSACPSTRVLMTVKDAITVEAVGKFELS